jgi:ABC-2 type transport system permease protein
MRKMLNLIFLELLKMRKKSRSYLGFLGLLGMTILMGIGLRYGGPPEHRVIGAMPREMIAVGSFLTAGFMAAFIMEGMFVFFAPLIISMVAGDMVSGEAADGSLRTALSGTASRLAFFGAKFVGSLTYTILLTFFLGVAAYIVGLIALGRGPVSVVWSGFAVYPEGEGLIRLVGAYALACVPMLTVAAIALFISTVVNSSNTAIIGPMVLIIGLSIVGEISYFAPAKPYFFTTYMDVWKSAFAPDVSWSAIAKGISYLLAHVIAFTGSAAYIFNRKDILT